jgi:hypothetical protein
MVQSYQLLNKLVEIRSGFGFCPQFAGVRVHLFEVVKVQEGDLDSAVQVSLCIFCEVIGMRWP